MASGDLLIFIVLLLPEEARRLYNRAVVAASQRTSVRNSDDHLVAVPNYQLGSADFELRSLSAAQLRSSREPPTRCRWPGCAGGSGVVLELLQLASATRAAASTMSTPTRDLPV